MDYLGEYDSSASSSSSEVDDNDNNNHNNSNKNHGDNNNHTTAILTRIENKDDEKCSNNNNNKNNNNICKELPIQAPVVGNRKRSRNTNETGNDTIQLFQLPSPRLNSSIGLFSFLPQHDYLSERNKSTCLDRSVLSKTSYNFNNFKNNNCESTGSSITAKNHTQKQQQQAINDTNNNNKDNDTTKKVLYQSYADYLRCQPEFRNPNHYRNSNLSLSSTSTSTSTAGSTTTVNGLGNRTLYEWESIHTIVQLEEQARIRQYRQQENQTSTPKTTTTVTTTTM